jgi:hypothetical protein
MIINIILAATAQHTQQTVKEMKRENVSKERRILAFTTYMRAEGKVAGDGKLL